MFDFSSLNWGRDPQWINLGSGIDPRSLFEINCSAIKWAFDSDRSVFAIRMPVDGHPISIGMILEAMLKGALNSVQAHSADPEIYVDHEIVVVIFHVD